MHYSFLHISRITCNTMANRFARGLFRCSHTNAQRTISSNQ